jgi:predicted GH43/DUF377 family glycosyl hydrolase
MIRSGNMKKLFSILLTVFLFLAVVDASFGGNDSEPAAQPKLVAISNGISKLNMPVKCGEYTELSGDAAVIKDGDIYRMVCTGLDKDIMGGGIAEATSSDGLNWQGARAGTEKTGLGLVLRGEHGQWDHQLETGYLFKREQTYLLYYSGYPEVGWPTNPGQIGVAVSKNGLHFKRIASHPVVAVTPEYYDANGLYSPVVFDFGANIGMIYTGHAYHTTKVTPGIYLMGALSQDGINWQKTPVPVLSPSETYSFTRNGVGEADLLFSDGFYYLFFTANLGDDEARVIAVARSLSPFGPYTIRPTPVLEGTPDLFDEKGVLAPSVLLENNKLRMWYLTSDGDRHMTGYAEITWPLEGWN